MNNEAIWWTSRDFYSSTEAAAFLRTLPDDVGKDARIVPTTVHDNGPTFDYWFQLTHGNSYMWQSRPDQHVISVFYREPFHFRFLGQALQEVYGVKAAAECKIMECLIPPFMAPKAIVRHEKLSLWRRLHS